LFLRCAGSACLTCSAELLVLAPGARNVVDSDPLFGSTGAVGSACGTNVTGTLRWAIRFTVWSSGLFLSQEFRTVSRRCNCHSIASVPNVTLARCLSVTCRQYCLETSIL